MKYLCTLLSSALLLSSIQLVQAKTPAITTPKMNNQEYALALGFTLIDSENPDKSPLKESDTKGDNPKLPEIELKSLKHRCDISLSQPFAMENPEKIMLARGVGDKAEDMVIKIKHTPIKLHRSHYETEHLHIWSNSEKDLIMTLDVREAYKDQYVALQSGTLTILSPVMKEEYKAVLSCKE
ncbi:hypothetical protein MMG00_05590 [Ignatzschineria rhizosphaerae]|uniref:Uncharacterized protein n=1 Tax=Ignatzschineria rhizosphaerae TaxID=2923279 RepID=A0ABY3X9C6_9GAMM|nr:hypothetical protein [Ignatzschineria rhizosphaerae]UNM97321.1 hypothetical protein MMG00_05590 [Ignatzschineria rhizosphaerae]